MAFAPPSLDTFVREAGASPAEFARSLHAAHPGGVETLAAGHYRLAEGGVVLEIVTAVQPARRIGLFALPVLRAEYRFLGGDRDARAQLLARLDRAMQRGGG